MIEKVQPRAKALGESGCYFLSLCKIAEESPGRAMIDPLVAFFSCLGLGAIGEDAYVSDAAACYAFIAGLPAASVQVLKAGPGHPLPLYYKVLLGEREILRFERPNPAGGDPLAHFVVGDGSGRVAWDPWPGSLTVAQGQLVSRRIIRRVRA